MSHPLLLTLALVVGQGQDPALAPPPARGELDAVLAGLESRGRRLGNISFRASYRYASRKNRMKGAPLVKKDQELLDATLVFGDGPREAPTDQHVRLNSTTDGGQTVFYEATRSRGEMREFYQPEGNSPLGWLKGGSPFRWAVDPCHALALGFASPLVELAEARTRSIGGHEQAGGRDCVRIDWTADSNNPPGSAYHGSFWVAPGLGHALVRAVTYRRPSPAMEWKVVLEIDHGGFVRRDDCWLPTEVKLRRFAYYDAGDVYELSEDLNATFSDWRLNPPGYRPAFVELPDGTRVIDRRKAGESRYIKGKGNDGLP